MTDLDRLKAVITDRGMTIKKIAERSGIPRYTLDRRLRGFGDFTASEIVGLAKALRLTKTERDDIFLGKRVN
jgi:predicted transcriptional regulator